MPHILDCAVVWGTNKIPNTKLLVSPLFLFNHGEYPLMSQVPPTFLGNAVRYSLYK